MTDTRTNVSDKLADALKPCPFCNGKSSLQKTIPMSFSGEPETEHYVSCNDNTCYGYTGVDGEFKYVHGASFDTPEKAVAAWNTRHEAAKAATPDDVRVFGSPEMPDEIYVMDGHFSVGNAVMIGMYSNQVPNNHIGRTKYIRADKAALTAQPVTDSEVRRCVDMVRERMVVRDRYGNNACEEAANAMETLIRAATAPKKCDALERANALLVKALEYYADEFIYKTKQYEARVFSDCGEIARKALAAHRNAVEELRAQQEGK